MSLLGGLNWLDLFILITLIVGFGVGYVEGLLRQVIGLGALYVGAIIGAQYFTVVAGWIRVIFSQAPSKFVNALAFFIILGVVTSVINWLFFDAYRSTRLRLFPLIDHLGGIVLGLVTTAITIGLALPVITFAVGEPWPLAEPTRFLVIEGLQTSRLLPVFDLLKPSLLDALGPWLPGGLPSIFHL